MKRSIVSLIIGGLLSLSSANVVAEDFSQNKETQEVKPIKPIEENKEKEVFKYETDNTIPEGFEDILSETNYGFIDVFFANKYLGSFQAEYDFNEISFAEYQLIFDAISKDVTFIEPEKALEILKNPLNLNTEYVCQDNDVCKPLNPEILGVVFDEGRLSTKIYINYDAVKEEEKDYSTLLARSTSENSFVQSLDLNYFDSSNQEEANYSLSGGTILAHKEHRIKSNWVKSKDNFYVNQLYYGTDYEGYKFRAGYMTSNSFGYTFTPNFRMLGLEFGTSINTRKDLQTEFSEPVNLFLNERAAIKITRGTEIIYTAYHEAGNQVINTSNFPSGSYNLDIEIIEDNGTTRNINKFFVKSIAIPPKNENLFYANVGWMEESEFANVNEFGVVTELNTISTLPDTEKEMFLKLGNSNRWNSQTALYNEILYKESDYLYNPTVYFLGNGYDIKTSLLYGSNDAKGLTVDVNLPLEDQNVSFFGRYVTENNNALVFGDGVSLSANYTHNLYDYGSLSLYATYDKNFTTDNSNTTYTASYRNTIYQSGRDSLNFNFDVSKNNDETLFNIGFTYVFSGIDNWNFRSSPSYTKSKSKEDWRINNSVRTKSDNNKQTQWNANLSLNNGSDVKNALLNTNVSDQRYGVASFDVNHDYQDESKTTYIANASTNIVSDMKNIAIGGKRRLESGVIIDLSKYKKKDDFELFINDISTDIIKSDEQTFIPLNPYKEYDMYLRSASNDNFIKVNRKTEQVVPYPGNVQSLEWEINKIHIFSSQLIDEFGNIIISSPVFSDSNKTFTDEAGFFQLELLIDDSSIWTIVNENTCTADISSIEKEDIMYQDEVICYYEEGVLAQDVAEEDVTYEVASTLGGIPQKDIADSIGSDIIDVSKLASTSCYSPYGEQKYTIGKGDSLGNIIRTSVLAKNAPYLEISPMIKDIAACNNIEDINNLTIGDTIKIPNMSLIAELPAVVPSIPVVVPVPSLPNVDLTTIAANDSCYAGYDMIEHTVVKGDMLSKFAKNALGKKATGNNIQRVVNEIVNCNDNIIDADSISIGQVIQIPIPVVANISTPVGLFTKGLEQCYIVQKGDWLHKIAGEFMPVKGDWTQKQKVVTQISNYNNIVNSNEIEVGQEICLPALDIDNISYSENRIEDLPKKDISYVQLQPKTTKASLIHEITKYVADNKLILGKNRPLFIQYLKMKIPDDLTAWDNIKDYELVLDDSFKSLCLTLNSVKGKISFTLIEK